MSDKKKTLSVELQPHLRELSTRRILPNMEQKYGKKREYVLYLCDNKNNEFPLASKGDIVLVFGEEGARKSLFADCIAASMYTDDKANTLGFKTKGSIKGKVVLHIDTEQTDEDTYFLRHRLYQMSGADSMTGLDTYHAYNLKPYSPIQIREMITRTIHDIIDSGQELGMIILDQLADITVGGYNNETGAIDMVKDVERWTSTTGCVFIGLMHSNREGIKSSGHLGSRMDKKVSASFRLKIDEQGGVTTVKPVKGRKASMMPSIQFKQKKKKPNLPKLIGIYSNAAPGREEDDYDVLT